MGTVSDDEHYCNQVIERMFAKYLVVDLSEVRCNYEIVVLSLRAVKRPLNW